MVHIRVQTNGCVRSGALLGRQFLMAVVTQFEFTTVYFFLITLLFEKHRPYLYVQMNNKLKEKPNSYADSYVK